MTRRARSHSVRAALSALGICPQWRDAGQPACRAAIDEVARAVSLTPPGRLTVIVGPSGAGKTTLLRAVRRHARAGSRQVARITDLPTTSRTPLCRALRMPLEPALRTLGACGLSDAPLLTRPVRDISGGERWRLALARAMVRTLPGAILLADEFGSLLDSLTARTLALSLSRWAARHGRAVVLASTREGDLGPHLAPWATVRCELRLPPRFTLSPQTQP
ncbi:MAG: ATP-binding cassette domain-containing protein [Phycisphaeraceae bacterium]|nr:ATP-binding cassette domain-containing protein [Phycisphaeraceae bacterium]